MRPYATDLWRLRTQANVAGLYFALLSDLDKKERGFQKGVQQGGKMLNESDIEDAKRYLRPHKLVA
jgi:hypothetical protein